MSVSREEIQGFYRQVQGELCGVLEAVDGRSSFRQDRWDRPAGGGGVSRVLAGDGVIEKAAVQFSAVWGPVPQVRAESAVAGAEEFFAAGISIIIHPRNPHVPTMHANLRYFETEDDAWFGGGADLTPYYLNEEDATHFHGVLRDTCTRHAEGDYAAWKLACDAYFFLPHRGEARGVGGIFFDHLRAPLADHFSFQQDLAKSLSHAYLPIIERRHQTPYGPREERWHLQRRGRYAEFNLIWDRGTRFGLETGGRTESILASLPPRARWDYDVAPVGGSPEDELLKMLSGPPRSWVS